MKNWSVTFAVLVALAILAVPALAAQPEEKVTWSGKAVTTDQYTGAAYPVIGDSVHFAGQAKLADGIWKGQGIFRGTLGDTPVRAKLNVDDAYYVVSADGTSYEIVLNGLAEMTYLGITYADIQFQQVFRQAPNGDQVYYLALFYEYSGRPAVIWYAEGPGVIDGHVKPKIR